MGGRLPSPALSLPALNRSGLHRDCPDGRQAPKTAVRPVSRTVGSGQMQYGIVGWILVGLVAGVLAKWIMPGRDPGGIIVTILIGIAGGILGGFAASRLGLGGGNIVNILIATAGAIVLLILYRMLFRSRAV